MDAGCGLDFSYPYQPSGYCIAPQRKIIQWDSISTLHCCRNALIVFSLALAQRSCNQTDASIFLEQNQWNNCGGPFRNQPQVSLHYCGFDKFYNGNTTCSTFSVSAVQQRSEFQDVLDSCSLLNSSFDACGNCSQAIKTLRDAMMESKDHQHDADAKASCGLAAVISIAASKWNDSSFIGKLYGCFESLDDLDPGYLKLKNSMVKVIIAILTASITVMIVLALIKYVVKSKRKGKRKLKPSKEITTTWPGLYRFSKAEIDAAIGYYPEKRYLGRGSAGQVYKGILPSGQVVAIKHINHSNTTNSFTREVEGLSRVRHPNLVCLFGVCVEGGEQYLVYEYCSSGNLAQHLLRKDSVLTWEIRVKILRYCALALRYLHRHMDGCIVHRDIKLTNILLTEDMEPKLSDFGLAKMLGIEETKVFTDVRGTIGYMDPEYMSNAKLTCASDIYSFGIVALQLLSGQKVIELDLDAREQLTRKARDVNLGKRPLSDLEDPRLNGKINKADFESILQIAVLCVAKSSKGRPTIDDVFDEIDKAWKNTMAEMSSNKEISSPAAPPSRSSLDVVSV
ncbi:probable serine/threonine-protein kinase PBL21 [Mangifera indica]|uniref:probable serine/threonine-protein kinase PBL21 n=1 Tax=Mangifera indica TaxID=29780 RepID=UPI001CF9EF87|nr:probable serine/threonine-protein kinase PBL21 [Mangifera indica]